ncbi:MAG: right-handed parallel beta-helix repeat-containing protein [Candidatus Bathyarchaeia archaeon]
MSKKLSGTLLFLIFVCGFFLVESSRLVSVHASFVTGIIGVDTTWTKADSPYVLTGNILVQTGAVLTIEPGVIVYLPDFYLKVNGTLSARGTSSDRIQFISTGYSIQTYPYVGVIYFSFVSVDWNETANAGSIIENAILSTTQEIPTIFVEDASPKINRCTVSSGSYGAAVSVRSVSVFQPDYDALFAPTISNSSITGSYAGIGIGVGGEQNRVLITDSVISGCRTGIYIYGGNTTVQRNLITNNTGARTAGEGGIRIDNLYTNALIQNNTIIKNSVGLNLLYGTSSTLVYNNILDNNGFNINLGTGMSNAVNATYNWWGTTDTEAINETIFDFKRDFNLGIVTFTPFLSAPNPEAPPAAYSTAMGITLKDFNTLFRMKNVNVIYPSDVTPKPLGCAAASTSDWLASTSVTTKLYIYAEGLDTNTALVNQTTGKQRGATDLGIVSFGGPIVNPVVKYAETDATPTADRAPIRFQDGGAGTFFFQFWNRTAVPGASMPLSVINHDEDMFVIEVYRDGDGRNVMVCYGMGWQGTYAAGKYFDRTVYPNLTSFPVSWVIVKWQDTNGDGFVNNPGAGDTYTQITSGTDPVPRT